MFYLWDYVFCGLIWANIGIQKLNVFAMAILFVTTSALVIHDLGNVFFSCVLERILFIVSPSFFYFCFFNT